MGLTRMTAIKSVSQAEPAVSRYPATIVPCVCVCLSVCLCACVPVYGNKHFFTQYRNDRYSERQKKEAEIKVTNENDEEDMKTDGLRPEGEINVIFQLKPFL